MVDYYTVISRAIAALPNNTTEARHTLYVRARAALIASLTDQTPPIAESEVERERVALEEGIQKAETEALLGKDHAAARVPAQSQSANGLTVPTEVEQDHALPLSSQDATQSSTGLHTASPNSQRLLITFRNLDLVLFCLGCSISVALAALILVAGQIWIVKLVSNYFIFIVAAAIILCALDMLPRRQSRITTAISLYLLLISSYLFGVTTWILGALTSFEYWGWVGLSIGLCLGFIGVVPLAIMASALHSDWVMVVVILMGTLVTYGARDLARERAIERNDALG